MVPQHYDGEHTASHWRAPHRNQASAIITLVPRHAGALSSSSPHTYDSYFSHEPGGSDTVTVSMIATNTTARPQPEWSSRQEGGQEPRRYSSSSNIQPGQEFGGNCCFRTSKANRPTRMTDYEVWGLVLNLNETSSKKPTESERAVAPVSRAESFAVVCNIIKKDTG